MLFHFIIFKPVFHAQLTLIASLYVILTFKSIPFKLKYIHLIKLMVNGYTFKGSNLSALVPYFFGYKTEFFPSKTISKI